MLPSPASRPAPRPHTTNLSQGTPASQIVQNILVPVLTDVWMHICI